MGTRLTATKRCRSAQWCFAAVVFALSAACAGRVALERSADKSPRWRVVRVSASALAGALPDALVPAALSTVQAGSEAGYEIHAIAASQDDARPSAEFRTSNETHAFEARFGTAGVTVTPNDAGSPARPLLLTLAAYGPPGSLTAVHPDRWHIQGSRAARDVATTIGTFEEWYVNGRLGLEQGFTIPSPPAVMGRSLVIELAIAHDWTIAARTASSVQLSNAGSTFRYGHLFANDAAGRRLPATLTTSGDRIQLTIDAINASYPVTVDPFIEQQKLLAPDGTADDLFGFDVAIDGDTALLGAFFDDVGTKPNMGSVYVFTRTASGWAFRQQLTPSDGGEGDLFGRGIALSGDTALITARSHDVGANGDQGAVYQFERTGGVFNQTNTLTATDGQANQRFGTDIALSGDTAVIGASSAAYVFTRTGGTFSQQQKLVASRPAAFNFGESVDISGDTILVGAWGSTVNGVISSGAAYVFVRIAGLFSERQILTVQETGLHFGEEVAIQGDTALVSLRLANVGGNTGQGAVFLFQRMAGNNFAETQRLTANDGAANDQFGSALAMDREDTALIGTYARNSQRGAVYVFRRSGSGFTQDQVLTASDGAPGDQFSAPAMSGSTIMVGAVAYANNRGAAYVFEEPLTLGVPSGLTVSVAGPLVTLRWNTAPGALSYRLAAGTAPGLSNAFNSNIGNVTALVASAPNGLYFVRLYSVGASGESGASQEVQVIVGGSAPCTAAPGPPALEQPTVAGSTVVVIWSSVTSATGYVLEAGSQSGLANLASIATGSTATTFTAVTVPRGTYFVRVRAQNGCGTSIPSNERIVIVP